MALTISSLKRSVAGSKRLSTAIGTFSGTVSSGGESLTPKQLGLHVIEKLDATDVSASAPYVYTYDYTNQKLVVFKTDGSATSSKPTFTVTKGAITTSTELGLSADAATATVNNNTIASTLTLTPNGPVGTPTITFAGAALAEATGSLTNVVRITAIGY